MLTPGTGLGTWLTSFRLSPPIPGAEPRPPHPSQNLTSQGKAPQLQECSQLHLSLTTSFVSLNCRSLSSLRQQMVENSPRGKKKGRKPKHLTSNIIHPEFFPLPTCCIQFKLLNYKHTCVTPIMYVYTSRSKSRHSVTGGSP